jgi:transaldolase / glucose-6-phosphate isomerase
MGVNVSELLARALRMMHACDACVPAQENPGLALGAALGELAKSHTRNKVTFLVPKMIAPLGIWLEQLLAESTGKEGKGLLPVANEPIGEPAVYGNDRVFVYIRMKDTTDKNLQTSVSALREAGQPVISIFLDDLLDLGQEFFRWEIATATAGVILGINPFDQPNVQESKDNTNRLLAMVGAQGSLPEEKPSLVKRPVRLYFNETASTVPATLKQFLAQVRPGDYLALMAYIAENPANQRALQDIRRLLQERLHLTTTLGYGPRFLHSTGQFHKGGPNTGLFLQITADDARDIPIPGAPYTFGVFKRAQALGDLQALQKHKRRVGHIDLGPDTTLGLAAFRKALETALKSMEVKP